MSASKYGLADIPVGETKRFPDVTPDEHQKIKRSAHNYNERSSMYFLTRYHEDTLFVTRLK